MIARVILGTEHATAIRAAAAEAYPSECCGLLIGEGERVTRLLAAANIASDPTRHFEIDPHILFDHMRSARETNTRIMGHYHSHPNGNAEPSTEDAHMALDAAAAWVIAAVTEGGVALRAFVPAGESFRDIPIL